MHTNLNSAAPSKTRSQRKKRRHGWRLPIGLLFLSVVPILGGAMRLSQLMGGAEITAENARFFDAPFPVVLHIISVTLFAVLGALQFAPALRKRTPGWHRHLGRIAAPAGLVAALSGLWMSQFYALPAHDGLLLYWLRLFVGLGMVLAILASLVAIWQRNYLQHAAWMTRGYALGMGAGTQVFILIPWLLFPAWQGPLFRGLLMGAAWLFNMIVAEWWIQTQLFNRKRRRKTAVSLTN